MRLGRLLCALFALILVAGCKEDDGPTGGGNPNPSGAEPTAAGTANGAPASGTIGAAGGSVWSTDGRLEVVVPAGALAADTEITIQPITNTAWGGVGSGYRLTPDGLAFAAAVSLVFEVPALLLEGSAPEFLDGAVQDDAGYWYVLKNATYDSGEGTLTCLTSHFSDYSLIEGVQIVPREASVGVNEQVALSVQYCHREVYTGEDDDLVALVATCDDELARLGTFANWSVNGVPGGSSTYGTVVEGASPQNATYTAPAGVPDPNPVAVSVETNYDGQSALLVSNITISDEWVGTTTTDYTAFVVTTTVTWEYVGTQGTLASYWPTGTVTVTPTFPECDATLEPSTHSIDLGTDGFLEVDYATDPPTFNGIGETSWSAVLCITCPPGEPGCQDPYVAGGAWFYANGNVSADGTTISGTSDFGGAPITFSFTRQP